MNLVTLDRNWTSKRLGTTYPVGTVFIRSIRDNEDWAFACPGGTRGECLLRGEQPGL